MVKRKSQKKSATLRLAIKQSIRMNYHRILKEDGPDNDDIDFMWAILWNRMNRVSGLPKSKELQKLERRVEQREGDIRSTIIE